MSERRDYDTWYAIFALTMMIIVIFIVNQYQKSCIDDLQRRVAELEQAID